MLEMVSPPGWKRGRGYSHAIRAGGRVTVAGILPWDPATHEIQNGDFGAQWRQVLTNIKELLASISLTPDRVISLRVYVTDLAAYHAASTAVGEAWAGVFGRHYPAITLVQVSGLVESAAMLEIEVEALDAGEGTCS